MPCFRPAPGWREQSSRVAARMYSAAWKPFRFQEFFFCLPCSPLLLPCACECSAWDCNRVGTQKAATSLSHLGSAFSVSTGVMSCMMIRCSGHDPVSQLGKAPQTHEISQSDHEQHPHDLSSILMILFACCFTHHGHEVDKS